jgi:WD40 repeat protein
VAQHPKLLSSISRTAVIVAAGLIAGCTSIFPVAVPAVQSAPTIEEYESPDYRYARFSACNTPADQTSYFSNNRNVRIKLSLLSFTEGCQQGGGCHVSVENEIEYFSVSEMGHKGGGFPKIADADAARLDQLLGALPPEPLLPPKPRQVLVSVPAGTVWRTRIYDRANMPAEIIQLALITGRSVPAFVLRIKPKAVNEAHRHNDGGLALSPDGKVLVSGSWFADLKIWNPVTREATHSTKVLSGFALEGLRFSPNGRYLLGYDHDKLKVLSATDWQPIAMLQVPYRQRTVGTVNFSADGNYLFVSNPQGITAFQVLDWRIVKLPGLPEDTTALFPSANGKWLIIGRTNEVTVLRSTQRQVADTKLATDGALVLASFSPDHRRVAVVSSYENRDVGAVYRIRVFDLPTGQLVHELSPNEMQYMESVEALLWSPDSQYVMGVTKSDGFFTSRNVNVWNVATGRHRGDFEGCPLNVTGIALTPDGKTLIAGCIDGKIRFWDFAAGIAQIKAFEAMFTSQSK